MPETKNWYILHTRYATEAKLASILSRKGYESYCPRYTETQLAHADEKYPQQDVLFSSWVFVRCTMAELLLFKASNQSVKVVYRLDQPAVVADEEISFIKHALSYYRDLQLVKTGFQPSVQPTNSAEDGLSYALPSLGFVLMARNEIDYVYQPLWTTNGVLPAGTRDSLKQRQRLRLKQIPSLVSEKVLKLSTVLSRATWS